MTNEEFIKSISLDGEKWKDIEGFENRYMVSSFGRIASLNIDYETHPYGKTLHLHRNPIILKLTPFKNTGYLYFMVRKDGKRYKFTVHRVVAKTFIENPNNLPQVDHIDGNRQNNNASNLRFCDAVTNMANTVTQQRVEDGRERVNFPYRKITLQIKDGVILKRYNSAYETRIDGFNPSSVIKCCLGSSKTYKSFQWMYLSDYDKLSSR